MFISNLNYSNVFAWCHEYGSSRLQLTSDLSHPWHTAARGHWCLQSNLCFHYSTVDKLALLLSRHHTTSSRRNELALGSHFIRVWTEVRDRAITEQKLANVRPLIHVITSPDKTIIDSHACFQDKKPIPGLKLGHHFKMLVPYMYCAC